MKTTKKNTKAKAQRDMLLQHLRSGKNITIREAFALYGIQSLTKRLSELREEGFTIINGKTLENGLEVGVWIMKFDPFKSVYTPFVKGDKVRLLKDSCLGHLRAGMAGEIIITDRRDSTSLVDVAGRRVWFNNAILERFVPLEVGTKVTVTGPAWIAGYNLGSNTYTIQTPTHEFTIPATQVQVDVAHVREDDEE